MTRRSGSDRLRARLLAGGMLWLLALPLCSDAQGTGGQTVVDSKVGYIDSAIPADQFRLRFDAADGDHHPSRAEFFYARGGPLGPGQDRPEASVNYQELTACGEAKLGEDFSAFVELPARFLQPTINPREAGLGDMNLGCKWALLRSADTVGTFQFRAYVPTGDATRGLGTNHVSLEPALLGYQRLTDDLALEGELRYWIPAGGTDFAGPIVRYGVGLHYDLWRGAGFGLSPVAELVGWTVLGGKESVLHPNGVEEVEDAAGQTIVNVKLGARLTLGEHTDLYAGYGRPLTGDRWYNDIVRVELRFHY